MPKPKDSANKLSVSVVYHENDQCEVVAMINFMSRPFGLYFLFFQRILFLKLDNIADPVKNIIFVVDISKSSDSFPY